MNDELAMTDVVRMIGTVSVRHSHTVNSLLTYSYGNNFAIFRPVVLSGNAASSSHSNPATTIAAVCRPRAPADVRRLVAVERDAIARDAMFDRLQQRDRARR